MVRRSPGERSGFGVVNGCHRSGPCVWFSRRLGANYPCALRSVSARSIAAAKPSGFGPSGPRTTPQRPRRSARSPSGQSTIDHAGDGDGGALWAAWKGLDNQWLPFHFFPQTHFQSLPYDDDTPTCRWREAIGDDGCLRKFAGLPPIDRLARPIGSPHRSTPLPYEASSGKPCRRRRCDNLATRATCSAKRP